MYPSNQAKKRYGWVALCLMGLAGCATQSGGSGQGTGPRGLPADFCAENPDAAGCESEGESALNELTAFLSTNRSRLIRNDAREAGAALTVRTSVCATFSWSFEPEDADELLDLAIPPSDAPGTESVLNIRRVRQDPGAEGTQVVFRVTATPNDTGGPEDPDCPSPRLQVDPVTEEIVITVVRPAGALTASLSSDANTVAPGESIVVRALISGGKPFIGGNDPCGEQSEANPANNGVPYCVSWSFAETLTDGSALTGELEIDPLKDLDGATLTEAVYTAPDATGDVIFNLSVIDQSGNRVTSALPVEITSSDVLSFAKAAAGKAQIAPRETVDLTVSPQGGTPPYRVTFTINDEEGGTLTSDGENGLSVVVSCMPEGDESCEVTVQYTAAADRAGPDLVSVQVQDSVGANAGTTIPLIVASQKPLTVTAKSQVVNLLTNTSTPAGADIEGGTPPYTVCFGVSAGAGQSSGTLSAGSGGCGPINTLSNCTCSVGDPQGTGLTLVSVDRTYTSPGSASDVLLTVTVQDNVGARSTNLLGIRVSSFGGGGGGGGGGGACSGGPVSVNASATDNALCFGESTTITAVPSGGSPPYNFVFSITAFQPGEGLDAVGTILQPKSTNCGAPNATVNYLAPSGTAVNRTITVTVSEAGGSTSTTTVAINTSAFPLATASNNGPACVGESVTLSGGEPGHSYSWTGPGGFSTNVQSPVLNNIALANAGLYTLTVTNTGGCSSIATTTVVVNPNPTVVALSNATVCKSALNFAVCATPIAAAGTTFVWSGTGAAFLSNTTDECPTFNVTAAPPGAYTVRVAVTDGNGCVTDSNSASLVVNSLPFASAGPDQQVCIDDVSVAVGGSPTASGGTAPYSITWTGSGAAFLDSTSVANPNFDIVAAGPGAYQVCVTVGDAVTCNSPIDCATLTVRPSPSAAAGPDVQVCDDAPAVAVGGAPTASGGTGPYSFLWSGTGAPFLSSINVANPTFSAVTAPPDTYSLTVTVADNNGCTDDDTATVVVHPNPSAVITADNPVCPGSTLNAATVPSAGPGASYVWAVTGASNVVGQGTPAITYTAGAGPTVTLDVEVNNINFCIALGNAVVTVSPLTAVTVDPTNQTVTATNTAQFTVTAVGANLTYQWQYDNGLGGGFVDLATGGDISGATTDTLSIANAENADEGDYRCVVNGDCGPADTSASATLTVTP